MVETGNTNGAGDGRSTALNLWPIMTVNPVVIAGMGAMSYWASGQVAQGEKVAVHWNLEGTADGFMEAREVFFIMPGLGIMLTLLFLVLPWIDPRKENLAASGKFWNAAGVMSVMLLGYVHAILLLNATGTKIDVISALVPALSVMFAVLGNYLGKTRPNWFGGVRTPWTLSSDYAWEKTHRLAGRLFVLSSLASLATWALAGSAAGLAVLVAGVVGGSILSMIASWFYWKNDPERATRKA